MREMPRNKGYSGLTWHGLLLALINLFAENSIMVEATKTCFDPDFLYSFIERISKMPLHLRKHIDHCPICQENILNFNEQNAIPKKVFGKPFAKVIKNWKILEDEKVMPEEGKSFFGKFYIFFLKYRRPIEIVSYGSALFGLIQLFFYLWG